VRWDVELDEWECSGCWFFFGRKYDTPIMIMLFRNSHFPLLFFACSFLL
jgi:hypothetical protein